MRGTHRHGESHVLVAPALSLCASVVLFIMAELWSTRVAAQATRASLGDHGFGYDFHNAVPSIPDDRVKVPDSVPPPTNSPGDESCFTPPLTGIRSPAAGVASLEVPGPEMLRFADSAVALDPANNPQAYFYAAGAYLGMHRLAEAEKSALKAAEIR